MVFGGEALGGETPGSDLTRPIFRLFVCGPCRPCVCGSWAVPGLAPRLLHFRLTRDLAYVPVSYLNRKVLPWVDLQFQAGLARDQGGAVRAPLLGTPEVRVLAPKIRVNVPSESRPGTADPPRRHVSTGQEQNPIFVVYLVQNIWPKPGFV